MILMSSSIGTPVARGLGVGSFHVTWAAVSSERGFHKEHNNYFIIHIFTEGRFKHDFFVSFCDTICAIFSHFMTYFMKFVAPRVHTRAPHACAATVATRERPLPYHERCSNE